MKTLYKPEDETEAVAVRAMLEANSISPVMMSFHDSAYDGLFQGQRGWGVIKVDESDYDLASKLLGSWKEGIPELGELRTNLQAKKFGAGALQQRDNLLRYNLLFPSLLILSVLLNGLFGVLYVSSKRHEQRKDYEQHDANNFLIGRVEWGNNRNNPYKYTYYLRNGDVSSVSFDANDDGRTDKLVNYTPKAKETYVDKDADGVYETCNIAFDSGSRIEYRDHDQNGVFESCTVNLRNGRSYNMSFSNSNGFILMMTDPSGEAVRLDLLKQIACEL